MKIAPVATLSILLSLAASTSPVFADMTEQKSESTVAQPKATDDQQNEQNDITLTNPAVKSGLKMRITERKIVIGPGQIQVGGKTVNIPDPVKVSVPPAGALSVNDEMARFIDAGKPVDTVILQKARAAANDFAILRGVVVVDSIKLKSAPGADAPTFSRFRDYTLDYKFGAIRITPLGGIKPGDRVFVDYQCWRRRIDTIAFDPQTEQFVLVQGVPARSAPEPPEVSLDLIPLANVYSDWGDGPLPRTDVMPICELAPTPDPKLVDHNRRALAPIIKKLEDGDPVHIAFWGDGVTQGFDARSKECAFISIFSKQVRAAFPKAKMIISNLGISNSTSATRLPSMTIELFALKPDVIVAEFVDDFGLPSHVLQKDYEALLEEAKKAGARVILCAPHCPSPRVARAKDWDAVVDRPFVPVLHELADKNDYVALADVFSRFLHLSKEGLRPDVLFIDGNDRPNNRGHAIYAEELVRCFVTPSQIASQK